MRYTLARGHKVSTFSKLTKFILFKFYTDRVLLNVMAEQRITNSRAEYELEESNHREIDFSDSHEKFSSSQVSEYFFLVSRAFLASCWLLWILTTENLKSIAIS